MPVKPPNPPMIPARHHGGSQIPKAIVIHATVSPDTPGTARNIANWWHGPTSPDTSAHYVVDPSEIVQCVGDHTIAYHCGFNTNSIGVELCDEETGPPSRWADANSTAILERAAALVAQLCLAYGIDLKRPTVADLKAHGPHGIYGHNDSRLAFGYTTHSDPEQFPWGKFLRMVRAAAEELATPAEKTAKSAPAHHATKTPAPTFGPNAAAIGAAADRGLANNPEPGRQRRFFRRVRDLFTTYKKG